MKKRGKNIFFSIVSSRHHPAINKERQNQVDQEATGGNQMEGARESCQSCFVDVGIKRPSTKSTKSLKRCCCTVNFADFIWMNDARHDGPKHGSHQKSKKTESR